jgi:predicted component of type VI protein secretion system
MRRVYQLAFRIWKQARAERQHAKRQNPVYVYKMDSVRGRRCTECDALMATSMAHHAAPPPSASRCIACLSVP